MIQIEKDAFQKPLHYGATIIFKTLKIITIVDQNVLNFKKILHKLALTAQNIKNISYPGTLQMQLYIAQI